MMNNIVCNYYEPVYGGYEGEYPYVGEPAWS